MDDQRKSQFETELKDLFEKYGLRIKNIEFPSNPPGKMGWGDSLGEPTPLRLKILFDEIK